MKNNYILTFFLIVLIAIGNQEGFGQNSSIWKKTSKKINTEDLIARKSNPISHSLFEFDLNLLRQNLNSAPQRGSQPNSNVVVQFPGMDDEMVSYEVFEASILAPELQARHPELRSYVGKSLDGSGSLIRFNLTAQKLYAMTFTTDNGVQLIDPYTREDNVYIAYSTRDLPVLPEAFICGVEDEDSSFGESDSNGQRLNADDGMLRTYRLALACTIEYADYHITAAGIGGGTLAQKKAAVLAAMMTTMNRVNFVYERDLSVTMEIIANNEDIIYVDSDTFTNDDANALIDESQAVINAVIGSANYDIGHTFSTGGGGLAGLGVVCNSTQKARGITGSPNPVGDFYDIDYVAHEMGHQFGASHTFNGNAGSCAGLNRSPSSAYEPGSGTTIMAYAGICSPQNVQSNSDPYFHQKSLQSIWDFITSSATCDTSMSTGNDAPTAEAGSSYTIPISTPYKLTGSSTDAQGTANHTYTWEQYDLGAAGVPTETTLSGPLVRSFEGTTNPTRYIPRMQDLVNSGGSTNWEKLVSVARAINFRLTVRDNDISGGQTAVDNMTVTTTTGAGPFLVTSQTADQLTWPHASTQTITWDVAGTTGNGVNVSNVNILLSSDGGITYDRVLASNTPNDGTEMITVPSDVTAPYCRVMVEAVGNIFYSINSKFFAVGNYTYELIDVCDDYLFNANIAVPESSTQYTGYALTINDSFTLSDVDINVNITTTDNGDLYYAYRHPSETAGVHQLASAICAGSPDIDMTFDDEGSAVNCGSTNNGDHVLPQTPLSDMDGLDSQGDWIFFITDVAVGDGNVSTWNTVTLTLCRQELGPVLGVDDVTSQFEDFTLFPNPNNGEFTIKFPTLSGQSEVSVGVFDIRGRQVFNNIYSANGSEFNETINLGNLQTGLYLVNVNDGQRKITKKIVVE